MALADFQSSKNNWRFITYNHQQFPRYFEHRKGVHRAPFHDTELDDRSHPGARCAPYNIPANLGLTKAPDKRTTSY